MKARAAGLDNLETFAQKLCETTGAGATLDKLTSAGAQRDTLLKSLADAARPPAPSQIKKIRHKQKQLGDLARNLDAVLELMGCLDTGPFPNAAMWIEMLKVGRLPMTPSELKTLRQCAEHARENAEAFRKFFVQYRRHAYRWHVAGLSGYVEQATGRPHDKEVANLLTAAYFAFDRKGANGHGKIFNPESVKNARQNFSKSLK